MTNEEVITAFRAVGIDAIFNDFNVLIVQPPDAERLAKLLSLGSTQRDLELVDAMSDREWARLQERVRLRESARQ